MKFVVKSRPQVCCVDGCGNNATTAFPKEFDCGVPELRNKTSALCLTFTHDRYHISKLSDLDENERRRVFMVSQQKVNVIFSSDLPISTLLRPFRHLTSPQDPATPTELFVE